MWRRRAVYLALSALSILGGVLADQTITVDGRDTSVKYTTVTNGDNAATWTPVQRSPDTCDTPQTLTSRLGDYMTFTFTGTGIFVIGTTGVKQGIINFTLDGQNITNFDRGRSQLQCDQVLFQQLDLPNQQHTVVATLVGRKTNLQTGLQDGVLSIQRVRYNIPGSGGGSSTGPIVGGIIGAVILIGAAGVGWFFWRRKRHPKNRNNAAFWDNEDIDGGKHSTNPGIVATPFEWDGPSSNKTPGGSGGIHYGGVEGEQAPGPSSSSHNNLSNSSNPNVHHSQLGAPMVGPKTHTSSGSSAEQRRSGLTGSTLVASNPDPGRGEKNGAMFAMEPLGGRRYDGGPSGASSVPSVGGVGPGMPQPPRPTSGPVDEAQLVDRIAHRLADIMTERVGVAGDEAPPSYVGADGEFYASPPPPPAAPPGRETSPPAGGITSSYRPPAATSPNPPISPQYVQSPPSASGLQQLQPPTPPANSTSFGAPGAGRFGPRPRPSGSVSGRPGEYAPAPAAPTRSMSGSRDQSQSPRGAA